MLVQYLTIINPDIETGVFHTATNEGPSKKKRGSKKEIQSSPLKVDPIVKATKIITKLIVTETVNPSMEVIPSRTGILKHLKKKAHKPRHSPERSGTLSPSFVRQPQINRKGVIIRDIHVAVFPQTKKRRAEDMDKKISKKRKKQRKLVLHNNSVDDEVVPEMLVTEPLIHSSPVRDSPV